jgi:hypothetical protein
VDKFGDQWMYLLNRVRSVRVECNIQSDKKVSLHLMITVQKNTAYSKNPHIIDGFKMAITIQSECGPCYTKHGFREHSSACQ